MEIPCVDAVPAGSIPKALGFWPQTIFPLLTLIVRANNDLRRVSALDPVDQTQQDAMIGLVHRWDRGNTRPHALPEPPSSRSAETVSHAGDYEETIKVVQRTLCQTATSVSAQDGIFTSLDMIVN